MRWGECRRGNEWSEQAVEERRRRWRLGVWSRESSGRGDDDCHMGGRCGKERGKAPETSHGCDTPGPPLEALSQNMHDLLVLLQLILGMLRPGTYGTDHWIRAGLARGATIYVLLLLNTKHYKHM